MKLTIPPAQTNKNSILRAIAEAEEDHNETSTYQLTLTQRATIDPDEALRQYIITGTAPELAQWIHENQTRQEHVPPARTPLNHNGETLWRCWDDHRTGFAHRSTANVQKITTETGETLYAHTKKPPLHSTDIERYAEHSFPNYIVHLSRSTR